jgi:hypothetical protein
MRESRVENKTKVESALEISKNAFDELIVRVTRIMHVKTYLLDGIGNLRASECNVLESPGEAAVMKGVRVGLPTRGGKLRFGVDGSGGGLTVTHPSPRENV